MTKKNMVEVLQIREKEMWESLQRANTLYGCDSNKAMERRATWCELVSILVELKIEQIR